MNHIYIYQNDCKSWNIFKNFPNFNNKRDLLEKICSCYDSIDELKQGESFEDYYLQKMTNGNSIDGVKYFLYTGNEPFIEYFIINPKNFNHAIKIVNKINETDELIENKLDQYNLNVGTNINLEENYNQINQ